MAQVRGHVGASTHGHEPGESSPSRNRSRSLLTRYLAQITTGERDEDLLPWYEAIARPGEVQGWAPFRFRLWQGAFADL